MVLALVFAAPCAAAAETDHWIDSRGIQIPVTLNIPDNAEGESVALVVLAHGHGGTRNENGGFANLAAMLEKEGIASIRMDFPGCGDSTEDFVHNNMTNMLRDVEAAIDFALRRPRVDADRIGLVGYSMGGRLTMLAAAGKSLPMVLWAPVGNDDSDAMHAFFGGRDRYFGLRRAAERDGFAILTTPWGAEQRLGSRWFSDMESLQPLAAIRDFGGPLLILHGEDDAIIKPVIGQAVARAASSSAQVTFDLVPNAGHGLGFYADNATARSYVLATTVDFFREHLLEEN